MRVQLSIACLVAATQAIDLSRSSHAVNSLASRTNLAQTERSIAVDPNAHNHDDDCGCNGCCNTCDHEEDKHHMHLKTAIDETEIALPLVKEIADKMIDDSEVKNILNEIVGEAEGNSIINDILKPVIATEITTELLPVDEIEDAINIVEPQEDIIVKDPVPDTSTVADLIKDVVVPDHSEITVVPAEDVALSPEDI